MAELTYKMDSLGIPGLSSAERVNAPKQKFTSQAVAKGNPYPSKWEQAGKVIHQATQTAISGFQAVASHNNLVHKQENDYITSVTNDAAAKLTTIYSAEAAAKANNIKVDPSDTLAAYTEARDKLYLDISNNKDISVKAKQKALLNVDKIFDGKIMESSKGVELKVKTENIKKLKTIVLNTTTHQLAAGDVKLKDIINTNESNLKALESNGKPTDIFNVLAESLNMYTDNKEVITNRFLEAEEYFKSGEELSSGFIAYFDKLRQIKYNIDSKDKLIQKNKEKEIQKKKKERIALLTDNVVIPPGRDSKAYIIDVLKGKESNLNITSLYTELKAEGRSDYQIANTIKTAAEFNVANKTDITDSYKGNINNITNPTVKNVVVDRIKNQIGVSLATNDIVTLQALYRANPDIVSKDIVNKLQTNFFNSVSSIKTITDVQNIVKTYSDYYQFMDKSSKMFKTANLLEFANEGNMQKVIDLVNGNIDIDYSTIKLPSNISSVVEGVTNYETRKELTEYAKTILWLNPNIEEDILKDKVNTIKDKYTTDLDVKSDLFDKKLSFDKETIKRVNPEQFKDAVSYLIDNYNVNFAGDPYVSYHNGLFVITDSKDTTNIVRIHEKVYKELLYKIKEKVNDSFDKDLKTVDKDRYINEKGDVKQTIPYSYIDK